MEYFRFTLFNNITLLILALTPAVAVFRWRKSPRSNWPLAYYAVLAGYAVGFDGSLNKSLVTAGVLCGLLIRFAGIAQARWGEAVVLAYVTWRGIGLLLLW